MNGPASSHAHPGGLAARAVRVVGLLLAVLALCLGSTVGSHAAGEPGSLHEVLAVVGESASSPGAPLSDVPPNETATATTASTLLTGTLCAFGLLCGALFFAFARRVGSLRRSTLPQRTPVALPHLSPTVLSRVRPPTLSQLQVLRT